MFTWANRLIRYTNGTLGVHEVDTMEDGEKLVTENPIHIIGHEGVSGMFLVIAMVFSDITAKPVVIDTDFACPAIEAVDSIEIIQEDGYWVAVSEERPIQIIGTLEEIYTLLRRILVTAARHEGEL